MFCDKSFSGCSASTAATAHTLGRTVLGQLQAYLHTCILIKKIDGDTRGAFKNADKTIGGIMREKDQCMEEEEERKQQIMDELLKSPTNSNLPTKNHLNNI